MFRLRISRTCIIALSRILAEHKSSRQHLSVVDHCRRPALAACHGASLLLLAAAIIHPLVSLGSEPDPPDTKPAELKSLFTPQQLERLGERDRIEDQKDQLLRDGKFAD